MWGWRGAFWATGAVGTLWVLWWTLLGRRESLATTEPSHSSGLSMAWGDTNVWALVAAYSLGGLPIGFVLYQASLYLSAVLHQSQTQIGKVLWVPPLGWEVGYFVWGAISDRNPSMTDWPLSTYAMLSVLGLPLAARIAVAIALVATLIGGEILLPVSICPLGADGALYNPGGGYTYHDAAVLPGVDGDLLGRLEQRPLHDVDPRRLVVVELDPVERRRRAVPIAHDRARAPTRS